MLMYTITRSVHQSISIKCTPQKLFDFISNPLNWPLYSEFNLKVEKKEGYWLIETPQGPLKHVIISDKQYGIMDTIITLPSGNDMLVPSRILPNGNGTEYVVTHFQPGEVSTTIFESWLQGVDRNLNRLKKIMEERNI